MAENDDKIFRVVPNFQSMIKLRRAKMDQSIQMQKEMSEDLGRIARELVDITADCYNETVKAVDNINFKRGIGFAVCVIQTVVNVALLAVAFGKVC